MDYAKAASIISDAAPTLVVGSNNGLPHINVYKANDEGKAIGAPFSITMPVSTPEAPIEPEQQEEMIRLAVTAAKQHLNA